MRNVSALIGLQVMASLYWLRPPGVWLRMSMLNSLVFSLRTTVRATRLFLREAIRTARFPAGRTTPASRRAPLPSAGHIAGRAQIDGVVPITGEGTGVDEARRDARLEQFAIPLAVSGACEGTGASPGAISKCDLVRGL
jgi:hypothetical protein